jgi:hypothetical protein
MYVHDVSDLLFTNYSIKYIFIIFIVVVVVVVVVIIIIIIIIIIITWSFYDRSVASSKMSFPENAI